MSLANIIKIAKGDEEEKVAMSLKVARSTKERLDKLAKDNGVSINSLLNAMILNGFGDVPVEKELYLELIELESKLTQCLLPDEEGGELFNGFMCNPGCIDNNSDYLKNLTSRVKALRKFIG